MHNTQVQELAEAIGKGAELVVVDPRFSVAASKARYWLPIKPGTDIALLLAWMNVILGGEARTTPSTSRSTPSASTSSARTSPTRRRSGPTRITGLRPELIRDSARFIAAARPASLVHPGRHTTWYGDDTQRARAMAILAALLGSWGRRGGYVSHAKMPLPPYPVAAKASRTAQQAAADRPKSGGYPVATEVARLGALRRERVRASALYDLKAWIVYGCNLMQALPDAAPDARRRSRTSTSLVAIDVLPAEICGWSDVVLPEATYLERDDDVAAPAYKRPFLAVRQEVVPPLARLEAGLVDREGARRAGRARASTSRGRTRASTSTRGSGAGGHDVARARETGVVLGRAGRDLRGGGARGRGRDRVREDRAAERGARAARVRPAPAVPPRTRSRRPGSSGCSWAAPRPTRSAAP